MPTVIQTFEELNDDAKEVARDWAREHATDYEWWESIYDDAKTIGAKITAFDLDRRQSISFELTETMPNIIEAILKNHGKDCDTNKLAIEYKAKLAALDSSDDNTEYDDQYEDLRESFEEELSRQYYIMLQEELEYMNTNEYIDDMIEANQYTFTEAGKRFG